MLVPAAVSAARRSFTAVALIPRTMPRRMIARLVLRAPGAADARRRRARRHAARTSCSCSPTTSRATSSPYMPRVQRMQREGTSFDRYVVTNSLCCPSRASILTGRYSHSTGIFRNQPPDGGWEVFEPIEETSTFATTLQAAGYRTALMGKYLNGYTPAVAHRPVGLVGMGGGGRRLPQLRLQPARQGARALAAQIVRHGHRAQRLPDRRDLAPRAPVHRARRSAPASRSCSSSRRSRRTPRTPRRRATASASPTCRRRAGRCSTQPQLEGAPDWLPTAAAEPARDRADRPRVPQAGASVQAIDRMVGAVRRAAAPARRGGQHVRRLQLRQRLPPGRAAADGAGKQGAWDHDIRVPLVVAGPGVPAGAPVARWPRTSTCGRRSRSSPACRRRRTSRAAASPGCCSAGPRRVARRDARRAPRAALGGGRPRRAGPARGQPPSYAALRFPDALYVEYDNPKRPPEYYDHVERPVRAAQRLRVARTGATGRSWPRGSSGCGPAAAGRRAAPPTRAHRVSAHAGDPDRGAQRPGVAAAR